MPNAYFMRFLLDPDPADGGGGSAGPGDPPAAKAAEPPKPPAGGESPASPPTFTLSQAEYDRFKAAERKAAEYEAAQRKREEADRKAAEQKLIDDGKIQDLLTGREKELSEAVARNRELEGRSKNSERSRELALALMGQPLISQAAAQQLTALLLPELDVTAEGEGWKVASRDGKSVAEFVKAKLALPDFAHFVAADKRGGTGATAAGQVPPPGADPSGQAKTAGELAIERAKATQKESPGRFGAIGLTPSRN